MFAFLLCIAFAAENDITVCYKKCPNSVKGTYVLVFKADDIAGKIKPLLTDAKNNIYFYNATKFIFPLDLELFQGYTIEFRKLVESSIIALDIDCTDSSNYIETFTFKNIYVNFYSSLKIPQLNLRGLEIEQTQIDLFSIDPKLVVETLVSDQSMQVFKSVDISNNSSESSGITLKYTSNLPLSAQAVDNGAVLTHNQASITFSFDENLSKKKFNLKEATFCEIEFKCSEISKLIQFSLTNIDTVYFVNSWPKDAIINVENSESTTLCANSTVLPVSLKSSSNSIIVVTQTDTTIAGDVMSPVTFLDSKSDNKNRKTITFSKSFGGSSLDLGSSLLDITIANLLTDISGSGTFPFSFRVGEGGISTLTVQNCGQSKITQKSEISLSPEFNTYLSDDKLHNLLAKNWSILTLTGVTFSSNRIRVNLPSEPFIHGFVTGDSCLESKIVDDQVIVSATPPSLLPVNVCFDGDDDYGECNSEEFIKIESLDSISSFFRDGVKNLRIHIKTSQFISLDLRNVQQNENDCQVSIIGYIDASVDSIQMNENAGFSHLYLENLAIGTSTFTAKEVTFKNCKILGSQTYTFKNCVKLNCDDDFVTLMAPHISSQGGSKIKEINYKMEKYNSITIADTKFVFYELDSNDNRYPSELLRNSFEFINIFYDVGIRQTFKNNNLNLTMETKNPPSFNITFVNQLSTEISSVPELSLFSWSQTKEANFLVYFNHGQIDTKIILTSKYRPNQLIPIGTGILLYETKYFYSTTICSTLESDKGSCPSDSIYVSYEQLNTKLGEINGENIRIYIKSQKENCPSIDLNKVNEKLTLFKGLSSGLSDWISISSSQKINVDLTDTEFNHLMVKNIEQSGQLNLGNMKFIDVEIDSSFKNIDVLVNDFRCEFKHLNCFKTVSVSNDLIVNGSLTSGQSTVQFLNNEKTNRLSAMVDSDASLFVGKKLLKIGETKFEFNSLANGFDAILDFEKSANSVQIDGDNEASKSEMPTIEIRKTSSASFSFTKNWKSESIDKTIFMFSHLSNNNVYLDGENTPISFTNCGKLTLVSRSEKVGVVGPIEFQDSSSLTVLYEKVTKSTIFVSQSIKIGNTIDIKFTQANIVFDVTEIRSNNEKSTIQTESFSNLDGDSLLVVHNEMKGVTFSPNFKLQIPIDSDGSDSKLAKYFIDVHPLVKINPANIGNVNVESVELVGKKPTSPGISEENIKIYTDQKTGEISLKFKENPTSKRVILCYEFNNDSCNSVLNEENIESFYDLLPSGQSEIVFIFGKQNTKPLNLDIGKIKGSSIFVQQENSNQLSIQMKLGHGIISSLSLNKVYGKVLDSSTFEIERIELLNGAKFDSFEKIDHISCDYSSVWKNDPIKPCSNHIVLYLTDSSSLTFTNDGFIVDSDSKISSSSYPNLAFKLTESSLTTLEVLNDVTLQKEITIYSDTNRFVLGSNWDSSSSESKIKIEFGKDVKTNDISVTTKSYPFVQIPQLMSARTIQIDPSVLPYEVKNDVTFEDIHSTLDFSHVKGEKAKVTFKSLEFEGSSSLGAKGIQSLKTLNDENEIEYPLIIENVEIDDDSIVTLSNVLIKDELSISENSILVGNFEVLNTVKMEWKLNKVPQIIFDKNVNKLPQKIEFVFDGSSIKGKENEYNDFLYGRLFEIIKVQGNSKCDTLKSAFNFVSEVSWFGSESILDVECNNGNLVLYGERYIEGSKKKFPNSVIYALIGICCALIIGLVIFIIIVLLRRNPNQDLDSSSIVSQTLVGY